MTVADIRPSDKSQVNMVSFIELKKTAIRLLPESSHLRNLILGSPDFMPRQEALPTITIFSRLLEQELKSHSGLR